MQPCPRCKKKKDLLKEDEKFKMCFHCRKYARDHKKKNPEKEYKTRELYLIEKNDPKKACFST